MTRQAFREFHLKFGSIGSAIRIDDNDYKLLSFIGYTWSTRGKSAYQSDNDGYTMHPNSNRNGSWIRLSFNKVISEEFDGIPVELNITGYFTVGPTGKYTDVIGHVGDNLIDVMCHYGGTAQTYRSIEPLQIKDHWFYIDYSLDSFVFAAFRKKN